MAPWTPLLLLALTAVLALVLVSLWRRPGPTVGLATGGMALAALSTLLVEPGAVGALLRVDGLALFLTALACGLGIAVSLLAHGRLGAGPEPPEEFHVLLVLAVLGAAALAASAHFASLLLGLELLTVALYGLIAYPASRPAPVEAGIKYLVLAGVAAAVLVFGMACLYAGTGALSLEPAFAAAGKSSLARAGAVLVALALFFKLALVPLHMWTPEVYAGAPAPVTALVATVSKGAVLVVLWRIVAAGAGEALLGVLVAGGLLSMLAGNVLALRQRDLKRLLAYSSIAHLGYLMLAVTGGGREGLAAVVFYLSAYTLTLTAALGAIGAAAPRGEEAAGLDRWRGMLWRRPGVAMVLGVATLSLAGIPLTAGFLAKVYVLAAGAGGGRWVLVGALVVGSAIGVYYYLRVVLALVERRDEEEPDGALAPASRWVLSVLTLLVVALGVWPALLQPVLRAVVDSWS